MSTSTINGILEKVTRKDKDYRYMATSDLLNELGKDSFKVDNELEGKVTYVVLQQLDDAVGDISRLVVKCLVMLVKKVSEDIVVDMTSTLCNRLLNGREQRHDIVNIALKTIISEITSPIVAQRVVATLFPLFHTKHHNFGNNYRNKA